MSNKIVMGGEYLQRGSSEPVRILCVDRPDTKFPVVALSTNGLVILARADGSVGGSRSAWDIVPAKEPLLPIRPGVYRTRGGYERKVIYVAPEGMLPVACVDPDGRLTLRNARGQFEDSSHYSAGQSPSDLVERIGDLP